MIFLFVVKSLGYQEHGFDVMTAEQNIALARKIKWHCLTLFFKPYGCTFQSFKSRYKNISAILK